MTTNSGKRRIYPVSELTGIIKNLLENHLSSVWVEGELSNVHPHSSGHIYFSLKDSQAQISCAMFRGQASKLTMEPVNGLQVRVQGRISVFEPRGQYQLIAERMEPAGLGSLFEQFEQLKKKLAQEGLFDTDRKRTLPLVPQRVALVTSPSGAAIRDMLNVIDRRFPNLHILVAPVPVQGQGAAARIAKALDWLNANRPDLDALIVGRGGGSIEDLWAFNEEVVARAVSASRIPVISAVGHETDFTICDFVADLRAPTPSAGAELLVPRKMDLIDKLADLQTRLHAGQQARLATLQHRLHKAAHSYALREPMNRTRTFHERIRTLRGQLLSQSRAHLQHQRQRISQQPLLLARSMERRLQRDSQKIDELQVQLAHHTHNRLQQESRRLQQLAAQLRALDPAGVLERGYSITRTASGELISNLATIQQGDTIETQLKDGRLTSTVQTRTPKEEITA